MAKKKPELSPTALKMIWEHLQHDYEFVRNSITGTIMWRKQGEKKAAYERLTDEKLNTILLDLIFAGYRSVSAEGIQRLLFSHYTPEINPIHEYLNKLPKRSGAIQKLANTVVTTNKEMWEKFLPMYLIGCVANVLTPVGCQNHFCLLFTGAQGKGKTTWQQFLCPKELQEYRYTGELDLANKKDTLWKLAEYWFIIIEEQIKALNKADETTMKMLISLPDVKGRRPFGRFDTHAPRIANFLGSLNDKDIIYDNEGSRRYLIFEALEFKRDLHKLVNINDVWGEVMARYRDGERYWIENTEIEELKEYNKKFSHVSDEMEYVMQYVARPVNGVPVTHYLPSTVIRDFLQSETQCRFLRERMIGNAMSRMGYEQKNVRVTEKNFPIRAWAVNLETQNMTVNRFRVESIIKD